MALLLGTNFFLTILNIWKNCVFHRYCQYCIHISNSPCIIDIESYSHTKSIKLKYTQLLYFIFRWPRIWNSYSIISTKLSARGKSIQTIFLVSWVRYFVEYLDFKRMLIVITIETNIFFHYRYQWTIMKCKNCPNHLGWKFTSTMLRPRFFYGLAKIGFKVVINNKKASVPISWIVSILWWKIYHIYIQVYANYVVLAWKFNSYFSLLITIWCDSQIFLR